MSMHAVWPLAFIGGFLLGFLYFRFLWLTVRRLALSSRPVRLLMISFAVRLGLVLSGFFLMMDGEAERLLIALGGFIVARELCKRLWGGRGETRRIQAAVRGYQ
jgi:F1F0 ATPase subunit 2